MSRILAAIAVACAFATPAFAERPRDFTFPEPLSVVHGAPAYNTLFLNRCKNGCIVRPGATNSTSDTSSIVGSQHTLGAFPFDDATWAQVVTCVKDTFEPFNVNVTDVDPGTANHFEIMIGNLSTELGLSSSYAGVSPNGCGGSPGSYYIPNALVFDFAGSYTQITDIPTRVNEICATAAQEIGHSFAMDHSTDAADPMTYFSYQTRRYFQDSADVCGSDCVGGQSPNNQYTCTGSNQQQHPCNCTGAGSQNSFQILKSLFGAGTVTPPIVTIKNPKFGASVSPGFNVTATATDDSAIKKVELRVDGTLVPPPLTTIPYAFSAPSTLGDGMHTVEVTAYDAHNTPGKMSITVNIGPPCSKPADCSVATDTCIGGRCVPGPGVTGGLGSTCTDGSMCLEGECASDGTSMYCVSDCMKGDCPSNFGCLPTNGDPANPTAGVCWPGYDDGSGGCSVGAGGSISFGLMFAALLFTRRRRA